MKWKSEEAEKQFWNKIHLETLLQIELPRVDAFMNSRWADTEEDFDLILEREFKKIDGGDKATFRLLLADGIQKRIDTVKNEEVDNWPFPLLELATRLVDWLKTAQDTGPLTYEKLFTDVGECKRITTIIEKYCTGVLFNGFPEAGTTSKATQLKLIYEVLEATRFKPKTVNSGGKDTCRKLFCNKFGWQVHREGRGAGEFSINLKKWKVEPSKPNELARKEIELILSGLN